MIGRKIKGRTIGKTTRRGITEWQKRKTLRFSKENMTLISRYARTTQSDLSCPVPCMKADTLSFS